MTVLKPIKIPVTKVKPVSSGLSGTSALAKTLAAASTPATTVTPSTAASWENDPGYIQAVANQNAATTNAAGQLAYGETQTASEYGIGPDGQIDPSNPFSRAAAIQRSYNQSKAGNTNSLAARGQLYSGALQNAQNASEQDYNQNNNDLVSGYNAALNSLRSNYLNSVGSAAANTASAAGSAYENALSSGADPGRAATVASPTAALALAEAAKVKRPVVTNNLFASARKGFRGGKL